MDKNQFGKNIQDSLENGLKTGDFSQLNEAIMNSVNTVIDTSCGAVISKTAEIWKDKADLSKMQYEKIYENKLKREQELKEAAESRRRQLKNEQRQNELLVKEREKLLPVKISDVDKVSSTAMMVCGGAGLFFTGANTAVYGLISLFAGTFSPVDFIGRGILVAFFATLLANGIKRRSLRDYAIRLSNLCGTKRYASFEELSSAFGTKKSTLVRKIKKTLGRGYFREGYFDDEDATLILSTEVYKQFLESKREQNKLIEQQKAQALLEAKDNEAIATNPELLSMINEGKEYKEKLHALNDEIPGEIITQKLSQSEVLLSDIIERIRAHAELMPKVHKLMDYYLPTMLKLVEAYRDYDKINAPTEDIIMAKAEIEKTLDTINQAFSEILGSLYKDSVLDVTTDAEVLQSMLSREGLTTN